MWDGSEEARRWFAQAENDLEFARLALREKFFHQACFIAQQSAEKSVKAIGYGLGDRTIIGHSVVALAERYAAQVEGLGRLMEDAGILDQFYIPTRYPNGLPGGVPFAAFHEPQARAAIEAAERFLALAREHVDSD